MSDAKTTLGVKWLIGDGSNDDPLLDVFTEVAEMTVGNLPFADSEIIDVTPHSNTSGFEEVILSALKRMAEITFKVNWIPSEPTHDHLTGILYLQRNGIKRNMKVILPNSMLTVGFAGLIRSFQPDELGTNTALMATATVKPTDYLTYS
jgi:hypothetical protein